MDKNKLIGFMVYWVNITGEKFCPEQKHFEMNEMTGALSFVEVLRKNPDFAYVTFVSQNPNSVGKPGVSDKLPEDYSWSKQGRAATEQRRSKSIMDEFPNE
jgi:hypothetical protein